MTIHLPPELERIINEELKSGRFRTAQEVVAQALNALREKARSSSATADEDKRREAVSEMLAFVEKNRTSLDGVSVKQLIHEGHRL
jgi:putative addiction module CopG family antidote